VRRFAGAQRQRFGFDQLDAHHARDRVHLGDRAAATDSRSRASPSRARADSIVPASCRYLRAEQHLLQRRSSSRSF